MDTTTSEPIVVVVDVETGAVTTRPMTDEELKSPGNITTTT